MFHLACGAIFFIEFTIYNVFCVNMTDNTIDKSTARSKTSD